MNTPRTAQKRAAEPAAVRRSPEEASARRLEFGRIQLNVVRRALIQGGMKESAEEIRPDGLFYPWGFILDEAREWNRDDEWFVHLRVRFRCVTNAYACAEGERVQKILGDAGFPTTLGADDDGKMAVLVTLYQESE